MHCDYLHGSPFPHFLPAPSEPLLPKCPHLTFMSFFFCSTELNYGFWHANGLCGAVEWIKGNFPVATPLKESDCWSWGDGSQVKSTYCSYRRHWLTCQCEWVVTLSQWVTWMQRYRQLTEAKRGRISLLHGWAPDRLFIPERSVLSTCQYKQL